MSISENRTASVCKIRFGILETGQERPTGFSGIDDFENTTTVIGFRNEDEEWFGFAIENSNSELFVANCDIGSLDSESLRDILPPNAKDLWSAVLLSSVDLEEIEDEDIKFKLFYPDDDAPENMRPFHVKTALKATAKSPHHLVVHKIFGDFTFAIDVNKILDVNSFFDGTLEIAVAISSDLLGEISDFETDSETLCVVPLNKDREPIES